MASDQVSGSFISDDSVRWGPGSNGTVNELKLISPRCHAALNSDLPRFRCRVKLRLKHSKAALALLAARNLPAHTAAA
jgi:hypothetical protein